MGNFFERLFRAVSRPMKQPEQNHQKNAALEHLLPDDSLNGQQIGALSRFRLGHSRFGFSGCEVIAVYNVCRLTGKALPLSEICRRCESLPLPMLGGFWGCNPYDLGLLLDACGLRWQRLEGLEQARQRKGVLLISFWNRWGNPLHGIHTVAAAPLKSIWVVYNRYGNIDRELPCKSPEEILAGGKPVAIYQVFS